MKRWMILGLAMMLGGCAYTHVRVPMDRDFDNTRLGTREGRSSSKTVLYLVSWGDSGTKAAAANGGIQVITHADTEIYSVLFGLYARVTTIVYGD